MQPLCFLLLAAVLLPPPTEPDLKVSPDGNPAVEPSPPADAAAQQQWLRRLLDRLDRANGVVLGPEEVVRLQAKHATLLRSVAQGQAISPEQSLDLMHQAGQREKDAIDRLARQFRVQVYQTFRQQRGVFTRRRVAWSRVSGAWEAAGSRFEDQDRLIDWLQLAIRNSTPGSVAPLPEDPVFRPAASPPEALAGFVEGAASKATVPSSLRENQDSPQEARLARSPGGPQPAPAFPEPVPQLPPGRPWVVPAPALRGGVVTGDRTLEPADLPQPEATAVEPYPAGRPSAAPVAPRQVAADPAPRGVALPRPSPVTVYRPVESTAVEAGPRRAEQSPPGRLSSTADLAHGTPPPMPVMDDPFAQPPPADSPVRVNLEELAARIAGSNLALRALEQELAKPRLWDARQLGALVDQLDTLVARQQDLDIFVELISADEKARVGQIEPPKPAISRLAERITEARARAESPGFSISLAERRAELEHLDALSRRLAELATQG